MSEGAFVTAGDPMENIIDKLKVKEDEMEAMLQEARDKARSIREDALRKAKEINGAMLEAFETEMRSAASLEQAKTDEEAARIVDEARNSAKLLAERAGGRMDAAVQEVMRIVTEGACDKGDDKGPDNRAEKPSR